MKFTIGRFDAATKTVPVTFEADGKMHTRDVNAVLTESGKHDRAATEARVNEVAAGVAHKFALGLLGNSVGEEQA
ncbi:hypothetical protein HGI47_18495 [Novosphingobium sp. ERN07]|uniref:hypothetical protein n=1 Tax=Novosphingobium sp. ERN07 TaxID=2726187 RepID=UPI0014571F54|nr:hypothetical protein [Novosphingobium sp. ERN07]NLR72869.1 hypothetical protein [Novosphingobium sp. ERN07]